MARKPEWRRDGRELFFFGENALQSVTVQTDRDFKAGTPMKLLERPNLLDYDVTPDGNRFQVIERCADSIPTKIQVVGILVRRAEPPRPAELASSWTERIIEELRIDDPNRWQFTAMIFGRRRGGCCAQQERDREHQLARDGL